MKQRLVGILVLLALGVILLPMFFDFDGVYIVDTRSTIPAAPDIKAVVIDSAAPPSSTNAATPDHEEMFRFDGSREEAEQASEGDPWLQDEAPSLNAEGIPVAWIIQIASFAEADKAQALTEKLMADGYEAYSRRVMLNDKVTYRIYVGPKVLKKVALDEKQAIEKKYRLKALLLVFEP